MGVPTKSKPRKRNPAYLERRKPYFKKYRDSHKEARGKYSAKWRAEHPEQDKATRSAYYQKHKKEHAAWGRYYRFGLLPEDMDKMLLAQNSCCLICGTGFSETNPACVDHDHDTKTVRGLLCRGCNAGLGCFNETPQTLRSAANYLENLGRS